MSPSQTSGCVPLTNYSFGLPENLPQGQALEEPRNSLQIFATEDLRSHSNQGYLSKNELSKNLAIPQIDFNISGCFRFFNKKYHSFNICKKYDQLNFLMFTILGKILFFRLFFIT